MNVGSADGDEDELNSTINTTPLVDVMLVLLIIFLITIPVVTHTVPVELPKETNVPTQTKPDNKEGNIYWNEKAIPDMATLLERMKEAAVKDPQPEVHIRGDANTRYEFVGKVVYAAQRGGISKIGFITEPPPRG
jgi:biopolymer transport protein ExbD